MNSVVITGMGVISPLGRGLEQNAARLRAGHSGIRRIQQFPAERFPVQIAGEVDDSGVPYGSGRMQAMAEIALAEALADSGLGDAGLETAAPDPRRALSWSTGKQALELEELARLAANNSDVLAGSPEFIEYRERFEPAAVARKLAARAGVGGQVFSCYTACASGNDALGMGKRAIERGEADVVIAGATDSQVHPLSLLEFELLDALSHEDPEVACRPFDRKRTGFVVGEGAAVLIIESWQHAQRRGARARARLAGYGSSLDSYGLTKCHPEGRGAALAMTAALADADVSPADVDYINAHGTGTILNDRSESNAIRRVWGADAARVPVSSTKSLTGHLIASASSLEAVLTVLAMESGFLPHTLNYENPDPECALAIVAGEPRAARIKVAVSNGFGFGGQNSAVVLRSV